MLREIGPIRQDSTRGFRRWFQDEYFDLFVWQNAQGTPIALQLCYDRNKDEGALSWSAEKGFSHARVDTGKRGGSNYPMTPILQPHSAPPYFRIYHRFMDASAGWEPELQQFVLARLREYRAVLFGRQRKPRRKRC